MSQDLAAILSGGSAKSSAPASAAPRAYDPVDAAIRTVYGEAPPNATREERQAIASVIANRAAAGGKSFDQVVQEPGQFEPWSDTKARKRLDALKPDSPEYQAIAADVGDILAGKSNPYPGLTHFYAPAAQEALGRPKPDWDDGSGQQIGAHVFFAKGGGEPAGGGELATLLGGSAPAESTDASKDWFAKTYGDPGKWDEAAKADMTGAGLVPFEGLDKATLNKPQTKTYETLMKGAYIDPKAEKGSIRNPLWIAPGTSDKDVPPGAYYVDAGDGDKAGDKPALLKRAPGGEPEDGKVLEGVSRGFGDVLLSLGQMMPGTEDSVLKNRFKADQMAYDADFKGDPKMGAGRFAGQVIGTLPVSMGAEAAIGSKILGPVGQFLVGKGAISGGGKVAQAATTLASKAAAGAIEGGSSAAAVSSASDQPLGEQILTGALLGAVAKPAVDTLAGGVTRLIGGKAGAAGAAGADDIADQTLRFDTAKGLPVPVPMTQGQITGAPAQQMTENMMRKGARGDAAAGIMRNFDDEAQGALRGNVDAISEQIAGGRQVGVGDGGRLASAKLNAARDAAKADIDAAYQAAREGDSGAHLPREFRPVLAAEVRDAVRDYDPERIGAVTRILDKLDTPIEKAGTEAEMRAPLEVRELFDMRSKLSALRESSDSIEGKAAGKAVRALDAQINTALKNDMIAGDPTAVKAWRDAIKKRADFGRLFEGNDLIESLTERTSRGGDREALKVAPEDATNAIFNQSSLGFVGKKNLKRDLARMRTVLGPDSDEWNAIRAEAFQRLSRSGEGAAEAGKAQFSGQKFFNAWTKMNKDDPQIVQSLFNEKERKLIGDFAEVAQRVTQPVKGGDNSSNTAIGMKKFVEEWFPFLASSGGASAGAVMGGPVGAAGGAAMGAFFKGLGEFLSAAKASKATRGAMPIAEREGLKMKLLPRVGAPLAAVTGNALAGNASAADDHP